MDEGIGNAVFIIFLIACAGALIFGSGTEGYEEGVRATQKEAVTKGVARWVPDAEGKPVFEWVVNE